MLVSRILVLLVFAFVAFVSVEASPLILRSLLRGVGRGLNRPRYSEQDLEYLRTAESLRKTAETLKTTEKPKIIIQMIQHTNVGDSSDSSEEEQ
uniref:Putative salivary secreted peptide n=1 Tax=Oncopeltus fasciatus TaxID=7536 RepID=A3FK42_ONCFA|nr:putative salivary secreted peptide precursor [Oncopeltus fasciatus]